MTSERDELEPQEGPGPDAAKAAAQAAARQSVKAAIDRDERPVAKIAKDAGCSRGAIYKFLGGGRRLSKDRLERLCRELPLSPVQREDVIEAFFDEAPRAQLIEQVKDQDEGEYWVISPEILLARDHALLKTATKNIVGGTEYVFCTGSQANAAAAAARLKKSIEQGGVVEGRARVVLGPRWVNLSGWRIKDPQGQAAVERLTTDPNELRLQAARQRRDAVEGGLATEVVDIFTMHFAQMELPRVEDRGGFEVLYDSADSETRADRRAREA